MFFTLILQVRALWPSWLHFLQRFSRVFLLLVWFFWICFSFCICCVTSFWNCKSCASYTVRVPSCHNYVFLALQRWLNIWFISWNLIFFFFKSAIWCMILCIFFANWSITLYSMFGELLWCLAIWFLMYSDCDEVSVGFCGIFETQRNMSQENDLEVWGVINFMSSLESMFQGFIGMSFVFLKFPLMFDSVIVASNTFLNAGKKFFLVMWVIWAWTKCLISVLYAFFIGLKQLTSSGWKRWNEWTSMQNVIMLLSLQYCSNLFEW